MAAESSSQVALDAPPFAEYRGVYKSFGGQVVLENLDLEIGRGEVLALLGPSGSGKTTALRLMAGFETLDEGEILVEGQPVHDMPARRRGFGMVFQSYALFPHLTVSQNIGFGLEARGATAAEIHARVEALLRMVDLVGFEDRYPAEVSGGQQQRVALARALAPRPALLLLDEPLSNLDPDLRERTRDALGAVLAESGTTTLLVTHEQEEAFDLGDRVAVLNRGRLEQVGRSRQLYDAPETAFVASFVGRIGFLDAVLEETGAQSGRVRILGAPGQPSPADWQVKAPGQCALGDQVLLGVRPEWLEVVEPDTPEALCGVVARRRFTGPLTYLEVELELGKTLEVVDAERRGSTGDRVGIVPSLHWPRVFPIDSSA